MCVSFSEVVGVSGTTTSVVAAAAETAAKQQRQLLNSRYAIEPELKFSQLIYFHRMAHNIQQQYTLYLVYVHHSHSHT